MYTSSSEREVSTKRREDEASRQQHVNDGSLDTTAAGEASRGPRVHDVTSKVNDGSLNTIAAETASSGQRVDDATGKKPDMTGKKPDAVNDDYDDGPENALKAKVLQIISQINLPPVPPLDEILHELGHDAVAEMTGRRVRLRKQHNGLYRMEKRGFNVRAPIKAQNLRAQQVRLL